MYIYFVYCIVSTTNILSISYGSTAKRPHIDYSFVTCLKQNDFLYSQSAVHHEEMAKMKCGVTRFVFAFCMFCAHSVEGFLLYESVCKT